jgi:hypothetical protein
MLIKAKKDLTNIQALYLNRSGNFKNTVFSQEKTIFFFCSKPDDFKEFFCSIVSGQSQTLSTKSGCCQRIQSGSKKIITREPKSYGSQPIRYTAELEAQTFYIHSYANICEF